ncbi:uncharacterized protein LOC121052498 [Rosa chinensis]|uniref:uncharacterized protein LOC121052498 n=1 Tax=Rosa chinensis TaxID=74649 RepID=UPI001AD90BF2|nr:uncharacterized protein LOC121052498 [Rosa chinensis]
MATVASLVANSIFLRNPHPKFSAAKLSATYNSRHASVSFSSAPKFNVDLRLKSFFSAAENNQYTTTTADSKVLGSHASLCKPPKVIKDHLGIGKPLGRIGGKWSTKYPYDPKSRNPSDSPWSRVHVYIFFFLLLAPFVCAAVGLPIWFRALALIILATPMALDSWSSGETSVVKLQVGFSGKGRDLGFDLNQIAETADTSTYKGLSYVLNETIVAFLRHQKYHTSASISVCSKFGREAANTYVDQLSINERVNNKESLVNVNDMKMQSSTRSANDWHNDDIMVTLFVGAKGDVEWPAYDLKNALQELRLIASSNNITAVEVLWTPQVSPCLTATST